MKDCGFVHVENINERAVHQLTSKCTKRTKLFQLKFLRRGISTNDVLLLRLINNSLSLNKEIMMVTVFGYLILRHSRHCLTTFPNSSKFVKATPLRVVFSTWKSVVKHGLSCLVYYIKYERPCTVFDKELKIRRAVPEVFLTNLEVFGSMVKYCLECLRYRLNELSDY